MAHYAYKDVCNDLPEKYIEQFELKHGREFDYDSNYNGDYWTATSDWIEDLQAEIETLKLKQDSK